MRSSALVILIGSTLPGAPVETHAQTRGAPTVDSFPTVTHAERPRTVAPATPPAPKEDVSVGTKVDRTAIWVGDRLTYTIEITCKRGYDLVTDDLSREKLSLEGLEVVNTDTVRRTGGDDVIRYEFHYVLTTFRVDVPALKIGPMTVRYYVSRAGQRPDETAPAGTLQVPAQIVAFRSLLPDDQPSYDIRHSRPAGPRLLRYRILQPLGLGLIIVSVAPVAFMAIAVVQHVGRRGRTARRSFRQTRQAVQASLEAVRNAEAATADDRRDAFARLDDLVRQHLTQVCGVPASSMTPSEIAAALGARGSGLPVELASSVLNTCEIARYAPPTLLPSATAWRDTLAHAEQVLATRR
jgi:hypothetical protein